MLERLRQVVVNPLNALGLLCMVLLMLVHETSMYYYLTIAQLVYIPIIVQQVVTLHAWQKGVVAAGQIAVTLLYFVDSNLLAIVYVISTLVIALCGVKRFLQRGFTNVAELMIDIGLMYIVIGGAWFVAHIAQMETGFSPTITWLTAIHFHYSACLLCITVGLIGRLYRSRLFTISAAIIAAGSMLVAIGITFSRVIEVVSVSLYVLAIFYIAITVSRLRFQLLSLLLVQLAFLTLCFTIIWSFFYAIGTVTIPSMLQFHGMLNCLLFGGAITLAWSVFVPLTKQLPFTFPVSHIRGHAEATGVPHHALVDDMSVFIDKSAIPSRISDFYEQTVNYELTMRVTWATWFKPFAYVYQFISRKIGQLNVPLTNEPQRMDSMITRVSQKLDRRIAPRMWQRKINGDTVFSAIYSMHTHKSISYMNIALPLPKSAMHGILALRTDDNKLYITSDAAGDAGTYLAVGRYTFKLPLHEYFTIWEEGDQLYATHKMTLFRIPFLTISYTIK